MGFVYFHNLFDKSLEVTQININESLVCTTSCLVAGTKAVCLLSPLSLMLAAGLPCRVTGHMSRPEALILGLNTSCPINYSSTGYVEVKLRIRS